jgi:hypothetical protein
VPPSGGLDPSPAQRTAPRSGNAPRSGRPPPDQDLHRLEAKQPFPGIYVWRDPFGAHYLVDHTGTRRLGQTGDAA